VIRLNAQQRIAGDSTGNTLVAACPGSGKTRVLTYRVLRGLAELTSSKHRVVAMTFTNRATDELQGRLDRLAVDSTQLWAGTIHSFALECLQQRTATRVFNRGRIHYRANLARPTPRVRATSISEGQYGMESTRPTHQW
jgi:superfamily I DNA/RNA helicase